MDCLLGIDIGTTSTKSALFTWRGDLVDSEYKSYPVIYPREGWAEQDPEDWWNALVTTVRKIVSRNKQAHITAMSLSTQGGCLILLDEYFRPLNNAVSWLDKRAEETSSLIKEKVHIDNLYKKSGWSNIDCLNFPTIVWFKEKRPDLFNRTRYFASTIDFINYRLTGKFSIDYTNLAMTMFLDLHKRDWSDEALTIAGITRDNVPEIISSGNCVGALKSSAVKELGLTKNIILVSGAHDQYCASIGAGSINNGDCVLSTGTAWVLLVTSDTLLFDENRMIHPCIHLLDKKYGLLTSVASGGNSLNWFQNTFCPGLDFQQLSQKAQKANVGSEGLVFIPKGILKHGKSSFIGIDTVHNYSHFIRSVFEGVALSNRKYIEAFSASGVKINTLIMIGGGAKSSLWPQIVADVSNIPLIIPEQKEAACAGAAILAGIGSGIFTAIDEASDLFIGEKKMIKPIEKNVAIYEKVYKDYVRHCLHLSR